MTIVNPLAAANLAGQTTLTPHRPEERQNDLRVEQIVRATVVEGGLDRAMLDLNHQRFWIQTEQELATGQQLQLQVLTTHPKLTFKLLALPFDSRLAALLPLLAKSFDWHSLLRQLQTDRKPLAAPLLKAVEQLTALLRPMADLPAEDLTALATTLGRLKRAEPLFAGANGSALASAFERVIGQLNQRVDALALPQQLKLVAQQIRQQPELLQQFMAVDKEKIAGMLAQLGQPRQRLEPEQARQLATSLRQMLQDKPSLFPQALAHAAQNLGPLLNQQPAAEFELTPALLGELKVLAEQLTLAVEAKPTWPRELQQVVQQMLISLRPLVAEPEILLQGGKLGLLSQLLGLNLEAEILRGRTRDALSSLKLALLGKPDQLGTKGDEALHRLELFQVCRVRLAEQNQIFVPLPLPFLEEGFLLVEQDGQKEQGQMKAPGVSRMSLYLRLSAIGNLRIDVLTESSGMLLRVACEDQQRADFLQSISAALHERLQQLPIRGISFTLGAATPARELIERIVPPSRGMLDARV